MPANWRNWFKLTYILEAVSVLAASTYQLLQKQQQFQDNCLTFFHFVSSSISCFTWPSGCVSLCASDRSSQLCCFWIDVLSDAVKLISPLGWWLRKKCTRWAAVILLCIHRCDTAKGALKNHLILHLITATLLTGSHVNHSAFKFVCLSVCVRSCQAS